MERWCSPAGHGNTYFKQTFFEFLNYSIDSNFDNRLRLNDSAQTKYVSSDIKGLIDLCKSFPYSPLMSYINISSLKGKVMPLTRSRRRPLSYRNQSIDLLSKSMDWFLYNNGLRLERGKGNII